MCITNDQNSKEEQELTPEQKWEKATLANKFIFYKVMRNYPNACKTLIEMLLDVKIESMQIHAEDVIEIDNDAKGIRLDVFVKEANRTYDIEMQVADTKELPERARYYSALMALDTLKSGQKYKELPDSHVIFLCMEDIFCNNLPVYTFENICLEDGTTKMNDRAYKHFFIVPTCAKMIKEEEIRSFFEYLISSKPTTTYTTNLNEYVVDAKHNMQWRIQFMEWERIQTYARDEGMKKGIKIGIQQGIEQGIKQGIEQGIQQGIEQGEYQKSIDAAKNLLIMKLGTVEQIAQAQGLTVEKVKQLQLEINE